MRFKITVSGEYEVPKDLQGAYGTTDPEACAKIDQENDPLELLALCSSASQTWRVEVVE
jgi:hypothetical protein